MGQRRIDITGQAFGYLTVLRMLPTPRGKNSLVEAVCRCGAIKQFTAGDIQKGSTKSCGCLRKAVLDKTTHGLKHHSAYAVWHAMHSRCYTPSNKDFQNYGGRGIDVWHEWHRDNPDGLKNFCAWWEAQHPAEGLSIDRRDNDLGYSSGNCRFVTPKEQAANSRPRRVAA
ncbi:hypothetical protein A2198_02565 [Candidatus Peribacteria bacterium RIFOXYA1_FULL_56_14]|nr:MAG: hypothetical protein A2198_02565 [Candidatus Peribacteria bacterium RIFOXYA1_FULL_56_14]